MTEVDQLRAELTAVKSVLIAMILKIPECRQAAQSALDASEHSAPFQQIPDHLLDAYLAQLRQLIAPDSNQR